MPNYNPRQLLTGTLVTILCVLAVAPTGITDEVKILALPYTKVQVVNVSKDFIKFTMLSGKTVAKPLVSVRRVILQDFPLFSAAERLASSGNYKDAVPVYEDAIKGLKERQKKLLEKSAKLRKNDKTEQADRLARNAKAKWPKKLFEFRLAQAKKPPAPKKFGKAPGRSPTKPPKIKIKSKKKNLNACPVCNGAGLAKCTRCKGSGYVKCTHIDNKKQKHANWYDKCRKCNGKGKLPKDYKKKIPYKYKGKWHTRTKLVRKWEPCPDCVSIMDERGVKTYVTWVCPHCSKSVYKGYVKCDKCSGAGKLKCDICKGTGQKIKIIIIQDKTKPSKKQPIKPTDKPKTWKP
ncbi:MAG: hypothetical protein KAR11_03270 [Phycisphaerae bacterium]|nr:hypothetical protein [Phycisphaerae bacterium]